MYKLSHGLANELKLRMFGIEELLGISQNLIADIVSGISSSNKTLTYKTEKDEPLTFSRKVLLSSILHLFIKFFSLVEKTKPLLQKTFQKQ